MCYLNNIVPEDVEYILARRYDGPPQLFIIDFDKVQIFENDMPPGAAFRRLIAHLSYPTEGKRGHIFRDTFFETINTKNSRTKNSKEVNFSFISASTQAHSRFTKVCRRGSLIIRRQ